MGLSDLTNVQTKAGNFLLKSKYYLLIIDKNYAMSSNPAVRKEKGVTTETRRPRSYTEGRM
jgi:hypothetical protein